MAKGGQMRLKVNLGSQQTQPQQPTPETEGWLSSINRNILTPAVKGLASTMGGLPQKDYGLELARQYNPQLAEAVEKQRPLGLASQEAPNPLVGTAAAVLPGIAQAGGLESLKRGGQLIKTGLGSIAGGELGAKGAELLGLGERGQKAAGFIGSVAGGTYSGRVGLKRPSTALAEKAFERQKIERPKRIEEIKTKENRLYNQVERGYKNYSIPAQDFRSALDKIEANIEIGVDKRDKAQLTHTLGQAHDLIKYGKINVGDAIKMVQNRNRAVYDQNLSPTVRQYNQQLISDLNEVIDQAGKNRPYLGKAYQEAKQLTTEKHELRDLEKKYEKMSFKDYKKDLTKRTLDEYISEGIELAKGQILPTTLSTIAGFFGGTKAGLAVKGAISTGKFIKREATNINAILKDNPGLLKELNQLGEAAFKEDKALFTSTFSKINDRFEKKEKKELPQIKGKIKFR